MGLVEFPEQPANVTFGGPEAHHDVRDRKNGSVPCRDANRRIAAQLNRTMPLVRMDFQVRRLATASRFPIRRTWKSIVRCWKRGQVPIVESGPENACARLVPDPFSSSSRSSCLVRRVAARHSCLRRRTTFDRECDMRHRRAERQPHRRKHPHPGPLRWVCAASSRNRAARLD